MSAPGGPAGPGAPTDVVVVLCTAPATGVAGRLGAVDLARALVDERLCACVNRIDGVRSVYHWQGAIEEATETLLVIKTTVQRLPALQARIAALHPYEVPEVLALPVTAGAAAYLDWVAGAVQRPAGDAAP